MTISQMQKAVYAVIFQQYMIGCASNDSYALHLAKEATNDWMRYIAKHQTGYSQEQIIDALQWELKTQTQALERKMQEHADGE